VSASAGSPADLLLGADQAPLLARPYFASGDPGPIVAALAQVPELLDVAMPFLGAALGPSGIDWRTKEIVIVRTSALAGCRYCVQAHTVVALDAGLSRRQVRALRAETPVEESFTDARELALIAWVDLVAGPGPVPDAARAAVRAHFADHEVVELTTLVGATLLLNRFATALALPTGAETLDRLTAEGLT
jgi:AhpD family alkylhydroperoxidase